jgi:hypothetical protein
LGTPFQGIILDQYRKWWYVAVPGPDRLVAVAIRAGAEEELSGARAVPLGFRCNGWVGMPIAQEYDWDRDSDHNQTSKQDQKDKKYSSGHHTSTVSLIWFIP